MATAGPTSQSIPLPASDSPQSAIFALPKKRAIIALRWPLIILCSYLLVFSGNDRLVPELTHGFLLLYIASNCILYFISEETFESFRFYLPLVVFDTLSIAVALSLSNQVGSEFYLTCFLTVFLCCVCQDFRGLIGIAFLGPLLYGYASFQASDIYHTSAILRIPFPFVIALFYGYFVQVEKLQRALDEKKEQLLLQKEAEERLQRQLPRIAILHEMDRALTSTLDLRTILNLLLEKIETFLPYSSATVVRLTTPRTGRLDPVVCRNLDENKWKERSAAEEQIVRIIASKKEPFSIQNVRKDKILKDREFFIHQGLVSFLSVPLITKAEVVGMLSVYTKEEHEFIQEEIGFLNAIANVAAVAIHNADLYEKVKKQAIELEKANQVKDEFLSFVSHELRTPLTTMVGYTNLVRDRLLGDLNPKQEEALQKVLARGNDLLEMINSILYAATLGAGKVKAEIKEVDLKDFMEELKSLYSFPLNKDIDLIWEYPDDLPVIQSDGQKLKHILQNLIGNALKFTDRGRVTVSARYFPQPQTMNFQVSDTGHGIPSSALPIIFDMFRQADAPLTHGREGVGLGLYIAKSFVQLLGGEIDVQSEPGKGSTFTVTVPVRVVPRRERPAKKRILVVESKTDLLDLLRQALEIQGFEVKLAVDAEEAVEKAASLLPDLIIMEPLFSKGYGLEVVSRIRKKLGPRHIPILAATSMVRPGDKEKCLAGGMDYYLPKPFTLKELHTAMMELLKK